MVFRSVVGCVFTSPCISFWSGLPPYLIMLSLSQLFHPIRLLLYPFFFLQNFKIPSSDSLTVEGNFWSRVLPIFLESLEAVSEIKLKCCLGLRNFDFGDINSPRSVFPIHGFVELDGQCYQQQPLSLPTPVPLCTLTSKNEFLSLALKDDKIHLGVCLAVWECPHHLVNLSLLG